MSVVLNNTVKVRKIIKMKYLDIFFCFKVNKHFLDETGIRFVAELPSPTTKMDFINHLKIDPVNAPTYKPVQKVIFIPNIK